MQDTCLSTRVGAGGDPSVPGKRIAALKITGMLVGVLLFSTVTVRGQWVDRETLTRLRTKPSQGAEARARAATSPYRKVAEASLGESPNKRAIVGTWIETVTISGEGAPPPFQSLGTFTADGSLVVADQGNVTLEPPIVFSPGHGAWVHLEGRTFAWTVLELVSDLYGNRLGTLKIRGQYTINEAGDEYTGQFIAELVDTSGILIFSVEGTNEGHRIQVEPLP